MFHYPLATFACQLCNLLGAKVRRSRAVQSTLTCRRWL